MRLRPATGSLPRSLAAPVLAAVLLAACGSGSSSSSTGAGTAAGSSASSTGAATSSAGAATPSSTTGTGTSSGAAQLGFEGVPLEQGPLLGPAGTTGTRAVDGIQCGATEQLAYHIHAHLAVFLDGRSAALPAGVGIPGSIAQPSQQGPVASGGRCIYWLHTHTTDGVIHIESPTQRIYSLGNFFDEWRQPLSSTRVAGLHGKISAYLNGKPWRKSPRAIPLLPHADIQFDIGRPAPPLQSVNWSATQL